MSQMEIENGAKVWRNSKGKLHREDGPALEYADGSTSWCIKGKYHRVDGPSIEYADGRIEWYVNGKRHRVDGPAVEYDGKKFWYINGKHYSFEDWLDQLRISNKEKIMLCLKWK